MHIFYADNVKSKSGRAKPELAMEYWGKHYSNMLALDMITKTTKDFDIKRRAFEEIDIARRKMMFWERFPEFNTQSAAIIAQNIKQFFRGK